MMAALKDYSDNTKRSYVAGIVTALKAMMPDETEVIGFYTNNVMNGSVFGHVRTQVDLQVCRCARLR